MKKEQVNVIKYELIHLLQYNKQLFEKKKDFDKVCDAVSMVQINGYGVVNPTRDQVHIEEPVVIKNGNIFIQAENRKIEVVDENSAIELIDGHYKKIDKSIYEKYKYNLDDVIDNLGF